MSVLNTIYKNISKYKHIAITLLIAWLNALINLKHFML